MENDISLEVQSAKARREKKALTHVPAIQKQITRKLRKDFGNKRFRQRLASDVINSRDNAPYAYTIDLKGIFLDVSFVNAVLVMDVSEVQKQVDVLNEAKIEVDSIEVQDLTCLLYTSPSPRDRQKTRMPSSA